MDVNEDGRVDLLSGSYSRQSSDMAGLFQVLWRKPDGNFGKAEPLLGIDGKPLIIEHAGRDEITEAICTRPFAVDWDGDGDLDLVVGNFAGTFHLFRGEGKGCFAPKSEPILAGDAPLKIPGVHGDPFCVDWDGDGDLDVVSGSSEGGVYWAENTAGKGEKPALQQFEVLIAPPEHMPARGAMLAQKDLTGPTRGTRVWVTDVDGDQKLDILVGDNVTLIEPAEGMEPAKVAASLAAWQKESDALMQKISEADNDARNKLFETDYPELQKRRAAIIDEQRTGFVWLYRRR